MSAAPAINEGDPFGLARVWQLAVAPTPGRLENTLRVVVLVLIAVAIQETFRIEEVALAAYIVLFVSRAEAASTALTALIARVAAILALFVAVAVLMFSLSDAALRLPLIAAMTFVAMFLSRTAGELAPTFFAAGFIVAYGLTLGEEAFGLALQPASVSNTADFTLPQLVYVPPEQALLYFILWLVLVVAIPVGLVGTSGLLKLRHLAVLLHKIGTASACSASLIRWPRGWAAPVKVISGACGSATLPVVIACAASRQNCAAGINRSRSLPTRSTASSNCSSRWISCTGDM